MIIYLIAMTPAVSIFIMSFVLKGLIESGLDDYDIFFAYLNVNFVLIAILLFVWGLSNLI